MTLKELKNKYGFKEKLVACDFNGIRIRENDIRYVNAYTRHLEDLFPIKGEEVICFQGDDAVWFRGTVATTPRIGKYFDTLGHTFEVDLQWHDYEKDYGYIEEDTFSEWI